MAAQSALLPPPITKTSIILDSTAIECALYGAESFAKDRYLHPGCAMLNGLAFRAEKNELKLSSWFRFKQLSSRAGMELRSRGCYARALRD
ncbi:hypothetical protein ACQR1W_26070 [Bradyrhizobium sp. HKCCYLS1011]|uniref:hypothetical protein n=1 Tax=Bradyrhizobium sp. HKCCYLS1011 TaxID=3420733 RepID=UPI003EB90A65